MLFVKFFFLVVQYSVLWDADMGIATRFSVFQIAFCHMLTNGNYWLSFR